MVGTGDLIDIILEEEDLPFREEIKKAGLLKDQFFIHCREIIREPLFKNKSKYASAQ